MNCQKTFENRDFQEVQKLDLNHTGVKLRLEPCTLTSPVQEVSTTDVNIILQSIIQAKGKAGLDRRYKRKG